MQRAKDKLLNRIYRARRDKEPVARDWTGVPNQLMPRASTGSLFGEKLLEFRCKYCKQEIELDDDELCVRCGSPSAEQGELLTHEEQFEILREIPPIPGR